MRISSNSLCWITSACHEVILVLRWWYELKAGVFLCHQTVILARSSEIGRAGPRNYSDALTWAWERDAGMLEAASMWGSSAGADRAGHLSSVTLLLTTEVCAQPCLLLSGSWCWALWVHVHKQNHLFLEEENLLRRTLITAFSGLVTDSVWGFGTNVGIVTLLKDKRPLWWQFLSPKDICLQLFSQHGISRGDLHWPWAALVVLTLPAVLEETPNFFQCLNSWQIVVCGSEVRCDIWQTIQAFLFFFLQVFLSFPIPFHVFFSACNSFWA